jgi:hypothetical protein
MAVLMDDEVAQRAMLAIADNYETVAKRAEARAAGVDLPNFPKTGRVSRAKPVHTALRNCTRDEGGPFEVGNHGSISSHCKPLRSKAMVVSVAVTSGQEVRAGKVGRGERKQTVDEVSKSD